MISVIIPVYNEEALIERSSLAVHSYLVAKNIEHEIILISNGSTDQTVAIGRRLAAENSEWLKFQHLEKRGVGLAFKKAVKMATYEKIVSLDMDLAADLIFIDYAQQLLEHCDMLVGSKSMGNQRRALIRVLGSQLYILIAQLLFRLTISDYAPSTKAFKKSSIMPVVDYLNEWTGYIFELCVYFRIKNKRVIQIGVDCEDHRRSKFNLLHEGIYRYAHLIKCLIKKSDLNSWFYK